MFPAGLVLLPRHATMGLTLGYALVVFATGLAVWVCFNIFRLRPSVARQVICAASIVPFVPWLYHLMTPLEFAGMLGCMGFQAIGVIVFTNRAPDPIPSFFGYHEVFHVFVTAAGFSSFLTNFSIVARCCGGQNDLTFPIILSILFSSQVAVEVMGGASSPQVGVVGPAAVAGGGHGANTISSSVEDSGGHMGDEVKGEGAGDEPSPMGTTQLWPRLRHAGRSWAHKKLRGAAPAMDSALGTLAVSAAAAAIAPDPAEMVEE